MTVRELNREQLDQLKQNYLVECFEKDGISTSYLDLATASVKITDEEIFKRYGGTEFTEEDFI